MYEYSVGGQDFRASQEERSLKLLKSKRGRGGWGWVVLAPDRVTVRRFHHRRGTVV